MKKVLLGVLIGLLVAGLGFGIYYYLTKDKEEVKKEVKEETREVTKEVTVDVEKENAKLMPKILKMLGVGSSEEFYLIVMNIEGNHSIFQGMTETTQNGIAYKVSGTSYSDFDSKLKEVFTEEGVNNLYIKSIWTDSYKGIIEIDGKTAIAQDGKTGINYQYKSQELISSDNGTYVFKVTYTVPLNIEATETEDQIMQVTGKVVDSKYLIDKIERQ